MTCTAPQIESSTLTDDQHGCWPANQTEARDALDAIRAEAVREAWLRSWPALAWADRAYGVRVCTAEVAQ